MVKNGNGFLHYVYIYSQYIYLMCYFIFFWCNKNTDKAFTYY